MMTKPTKKCRVFVSRKKSDSKVGKYLREELERFAPNLEFKDEEDILGRTKGNGEHERLRDEFKITNILLLVLTGPTRNDFDWALYHTGLFEPLEREDCRKVVCVFPDPAVRPEWEKGIPRELGDKPAVAATEHNILRLFMRLFHDKEFSNTLDPLNPRLKEKDLRPIAQAAADDVNGVTGGQIIRWAYTNYYIQLQVSPGARTLEPTFEVKSDKGSLHNLFGLGECPPTGQLWTWGKIAEKIPEDTSHRWIEQLGEAISAMKSGDTVRQLTSRFLGADKRIYRPEIEIFRLYEDGRRTIDITFSEQVQDSWLQGARKPAALAANLALASRIRHELIEKYRPRVLRWRLEKTKKEKCFQLSKLVETVEHDGYFIEFLTTNQLEEAFEEAEAAELEELREEYSVKIRPLLMNALRENNVTELKQALELWQTNNLRFLRIGLHRYEATIPKDCKPKAALVA